MQYTTLKPLSKHIFHKYAKNIKLHALQGPQIKDFNLYHLTFVCSHEHFHILTDMNQNYHLSGALHLENKHRLHWDLALISQFFSKPLKNAKKKYCSSCQYIWFLFSMTALCQRIRTSERPQFHPSMSDLNLSVPCCILS